MDATRQTWNEPMTEIVVDFMEAAVHTLLHARKVYPQGITYVFYLVFECLNCVVGLFIVHCSRSVGIILIRRTSTYATFVLLCTAVIHLVLPQAAAQVCYMSICYG